jgi:hypothetical protein
MHGATVGELHANFLFSHWIAQITLGNINAR